MLEQQDYEQLGGMIQTIVAGTLEQKLDEKLDEKLDQKLLVFKKEFTNKSTGSTFSAITSDIVKNILLPVPPLNEQNKIVRTITDMFDYLEHIEASLN